MLTLVDNVKEELSDFIVPHRRDVTSAALGFIGPHTPDPSHDQNLSAAST
jgi:hypothetical protein